MKPVIAAALALALSLCCGGPAGAIVNGTPVQESDPYAHSVVGLVPIDARGHPGACSGILLTPRAVLTAAHCVSHTRSVSAIFDLSFGDPKRKDLRRVAVTRMVINPDFVYDEKDRSFSDGDLAVIFLAPHDYPVSIIPLDRNLQFGEGQQFVILGYGRSDTEWYRSFGVLRKAAIAAGGDNTPRVVELHPLANAWPCDGDSGGAVLRKDMSGHYAVSGVMDAVYSGPLGACDFQGSFMTPIHTYADWIAKTLASGGMAAQN